MPDYTLSTTVQRGYDETVQAVRQSLADAGFGVLTVIDLFVVFKAKLGVEVAPQIILGACRPQLAHQALQADPSIAALLPCNVVVRGIDDATTIVEAFDPNAMVSFAGADGSDVLGTVATEARQRLQTALTSLEND
jgi:uncharacterized protein (DUF302 family)